jgi:hypothetical protein
MKSPEPNSAPRLLPNEPFPDYAYVPGRFPHPTSDPAGHSYGIEPPIPTNPEPERWQECRPYLRGIDLFNNGFFWEAHVAWESLWMACERKGLIADFLKGLIHLAAAGVKALEGVPGGVKSHSGRGAQLWRETALEADEFMGFRISSLIEVAEEIRRAGWPRESVVIVPGLARPSL